MTMGGFEDEDLELEFQDWGEKEEEYELSPEGIASQNRGLLRQYATFRRAADAIVATWQDFPEVARIALIGSVAVKPWKEVPRFSTYRRAGIELWHECKDLDLALWLTDMTDLNALRRAKNRALGSLHGKNEAGVAAHQTDVFILEPGTDRYLGRLCEFNTCPKGKRDCLVEGCGATAFLKQHEGFKWRPKSIAPERSAILFDRASGRLKLAVELPLPTDEDEAEIAV